MTLSTSAMAELLMKFHTKYGYRIDTRDHALTAAREEEFTAFVRNLREMSDETYQTIVNQLPRDSESDT